jgi:hypothetical protein
MKMNFKPSLLLVVVLAATSFYGCKKLNYVELTQEDYDWVDMYSKDQILKFTNGAGTIYTYNVINISRGYREDGNNNYSVAGVSITQNVDTSIYDGSSIYLERNDAGLSMRMVWGRHPRTFNPLELSPIIDTISGHVYSDVYVSVCDTLELTPEQDVIKAYYSKSKGFIKFETVNGDTYSLTN